MIKSSVYTAAFSVVLWAGYLGFAQAATDTVGTNIVSPQGTVYAVSVENNQTDIRPYTSSGAFLSYSFNSWSDIVKAGVADLALPVGSFIPPREGKVVCSNKGADEGTCYLITNGKKAAFTSAAVFTGLGYSFSNTISGDVSFLSSAPNISDANDAHVPGTLVNKGGTVYLVSTSGLMGVPDWMTLQSWGYISADIVPANKADAEMLNAGNLPMRQTQDFDPLNLSTTISPPAPTPSPTVIITPVLNPTPVSLPTATPTPISLNGLVPTPTATPTTSPTPTPSPTALPSATSQLQVSVGSLVFTSDLDASGDQTAAPQSFTINVTGSWTAQIIGNGIAGLSLSYGGSSGQAVSGNGQGTVTVTEPKLASPGLFNSTILVTSNGQAQNIAVQAIVGS